MTGRARLDADLLELLDRFADAWNRHDLDALMAMMTDDCVFEASAGPHVDGQRSEGKPAVRAAYAAVFETFHDAHWAHPRHFIAGNRGVSEWTFTGTAKRWQACRGERLRSLHLQRRQNRHQELVSQEPAGNLGVAQERAVRCAISPTLRTARPGCCFAVTGARAAPAAAPCR